MPIKKTDLKKKEKSLKEAIAELRNSEQEVPKKVIKKAIVKKTVGKLPAKTAVVKQAKPVQSTQQSEVKPSTQDKKLPAEVESRPQRTYRPSPPKGPQDKRLPAELVKQVESRPQGNYRPNPSKGPQDKRIPAESHGVRRKFEHNDRNGDMQNNSSDRHPVHRYQRIAVFVDVQNMYYSAKQLYNKKVNFKRLLDDAVKGRQLIRAVAYGIKADIKEEGNFFEALQKIGFEVKTKDLQVFVDGSKKGDWDVGLAMDVMRLAPKMDIIVLVSGDGDFKELVEYVKSSGCRVELMSFKKTTSTLLLGVADTFTDLASHKYLIS